MYKKISFFILIVAIFTFYNSNNRDVKISNIDIEVELKQKIGSLIVMGFDGVYAGAYSQVSEDIKNGLGGIILFDKNIINHKQLLALNNSLQSMSDKTLFISINAFSKYSTKVVLPPPSIPSIKINLLGNFLFIIGVPLRLVALLYRAI